MPDRVRAMIPSLGALYLLGGVMGCVAVSDSSVPALGEDVHVGPTAAALQLADNASGAGRVFKLCWAEGPNAVRYNEEKERIGESPLIDGTTTPVRDVQRAMWRSLRDSWMTHTGVRVEWGGDCALNLSDFMEGNLLSVTLVQPPYRSNAATNGTSMSLEASFSEAMPVHEFGHSMGFDHEQDGAGPNSLEKIACARSLCMRGLANATTFAECLEDDLDQGGGDVLNLTDYDPTSVMNYCGNNTAFLSGSDIAGAIARYGPPPADRGIERTASIVVRGGRYDTFTRNALGAVVHNYFDGAQWGPTGPGEENLGGEVIATPQAVATTGSGLLVVGVGTDHALWTKEWTDYGWTEWQSIGGNVRGTPAVVSWKDGRIDLFVRGADTHVYHKQRIAGAWLPSETDFNDLGFASSGEISAIATRNKVHVVTTGLYSLGVAVLSSDSNGGFGSSIWSTLGSKTTSAPAVTLRDWFTDQLEIAISFQETTATTSLDGMGVWQPWVVNPALPPLRLLPSITDGMQTPIPDDTRRLAIGPDGACWTRYYIRRDDSAIYSWRRPWGTAGCPTAPTTSPMLQSLGGATDGTPSLGIGTGVSVLASRGTDGHLWATRRGTSTWLPWERVTVPSGNSAFAGPMDPDTIMPPTRDASSFSLAEAPMRARNNLPAAATVTREGGRIDTFAVDLLGHIAHKYFDGTQWLPEGEGYEDLGGPPAMFAAGGGGFFIGTPAAIVTGPDSIDLVAVGFGPDGHHTLWGKRWLDGSWIPETGWTELGGSVTGLPTLLSPYPGRLDIFVRGTDKAVWHKTRDADGEWYPSTEGYESLGGKVLPRITALQTGRRLRVFGIGMDMRPWQLVSTDYSAFSSDPQWERLGSKVAIPGSGEGIAAVASDPSSSNSPFALAFTSSEGISWQEWDGTRWVYSDFVPLGTPTAWGIGVVGVPQIVSSNRCSYQVIANMKQDLVPIGIATRPVFAWNAVTGGGIAMGWAATGQLGIPPGCPSERAGVWPPPAWNWDVGGSSDGAPSVAGFPSELSSFDPKGVVIVRAEDGSLWARRVILPEVAPNVTDEWHVDDLTMEQTVDGPISQLKYRVANPVTPSYLRKPAWGAWERLGGKITWPQIPW